MFEALRQRKSKVYSATEQIIKVVKRLRKGNNTQKLVLDRAEQRIEQFLVCWIQCYISIVWQVDSHQSWDSVQTSISSHYMWLCIETPKGNGQLNPTKRFSRIVV